MSPSLERLRTIRTIAESIADRSHVIQQHFFARCVACAADRIGAVHGRRHQQPRARFPRGRWLASLHRSGAGIADLRCRWQRIYRPRRVVGTADSGPRPSDRCRGPRQDGAGGDQLFGAPCRQELELARMVVAYVPSVEKVRFVCSGTEATMSAVRLTRAATGRTKIVKMAGHYHGHGDSFLVSAGSGALTLGTPDSPGVPPALAAETSGRAFQRCRRRGAGAARA